MFARLIKKLEPIPVVLNRRRISIRPTSSGIIFVVILLIILFASLNYNNNMGFALTFLLLGVAVVSLIHTHANLSRIIIRPGITRPVFVGHTAHFEISLSTEKQKEKLSVEAHNEYGSETTDIPPHEAGILHVRRPATQRGSLTLEQFKLCTEYPLGIVHAWSWLKPDIQCIVYPAPEEHAPSIQFFDANASHSSRIANDNDDFNGFRNYSVGDSPKHIAWKQFSAREILLTKQFSSGGSESHWLNWDSVSDLNTEAAMSRLCRWVLECHKSDLRFGLHLQSVRISPSRGEQHKHDCLKALALFMPKKLDSNES